MVFYPVGNSFGWGREDFENMLDLDAFKTLWENRHKAAARFYDMDSHYGDRGEFEQSMGNADEFETDYNDEVLDGGWWCKVLHIPSDVVREIVNKE